LTLPGGQTIASQLLNPGTAEDGVGVFDGLYDFAVPADQTTATLTIAPAKLRVAVAWSGSPPVTVTTRGQATFPITFPPSTNPHHSQPLPCRTAQPSRTPVKPSPDQLEATAAEESAPPSRRAPRSSWPGRARPWC
jgi:hypothetical protein